MRKRALLLLLGVCLFFELLFLVKFSDSQAVPQSNNITNRKGSAFSKCARSDPPDFALFLPVYALPFCLLCARRA